MARKSAKKTANTPTSVSTLAISDLRLALEFLERENHKLLGKIEKKRTELNNLLDRIREIGVEVTQRSMPLLQQMLELDRQLHAAFDEIFTGRKLGKQTRKNIEQVYANLQASGLISPRYDRATSASVDEEDEDDESANFDWEWGEGQERSPFETEVDTKPARDELKKIRQLFLRLADVFHPDRTADPELNKYHTEVMQEINQAYQSGDLAKLLAIERKHQLGEVIDRNDPNDLLRQYQRIEREHEFLKSQFEQLKLEVRSTKNTQQGSMVSEYQKLTKAGYDPIGELVSETQSQLDAILEVHQFVTDFRDRRITIKDFVKGPPSFQQISEEELFEELLTEFFKR